MSIFYSGFSLKEDSYFFQKFLDESQYCVAGFSYGAILALKDVQKKILNHQRVDRLQLFSPAFFQTKSKKFKKLQMLGYIKNKEKYIESFIKQCFVPYNIDNRLMLQPSTQQELEELLNYEWIGADFLALEKEGVVIEVYLGEKDNIIDVMGAKEFFTEYATLTYIKQANHFLQTKQGE
jgi:hypothetical protein